MNPHLRLEKILALIEANPGISGQKIADICAVPWGVIQHDLATMLMATENPIPLYTDKDSDDVSIPDDDIESEFNPETKWYLENYARKNVHLHLTLGEALQVLDLPYVDAKQPKLLSLKQKLLESLDLGDRGNYRYIKGNMAPAAGVANEILQILEQAIIRRREISFKYKSSQCTVRPLGLVY